MPVSSGRGVGWPESILIVHNRYAQRGGEDVAVDAEGALLEQRGHRVLRVDADNRDIESGRRGRGPLSVALGAIWSRSGRDAVARVIDRSRPDIVHVHNTFPQLSPAVYSAARRRGLPIVQTLHNYRLICPSAQLFRDGRPCVDCVGRTVPWPGAVHGCYRQSRAESTAVVAMLTFHNLRDTWRREIDLFLTPSEFLRGQLIAGGYPSKRIVVKPNFVEPDPGIRARPGQDFLFVGRLTAEKGIDVLADASRVLPDDVAVRVAGRGRLPDSGPPAGRLVPVGVMGRDELLREVKHARAVVVPSSSWETFGLSVIEAFACGVPVIAARNGALAELVDDGQTGVLFRPGDAADLARVLSWTVDHPDELAEMGRRAREVYERRYTAAATYPLLLEAYRTAASTARSRLPSRAEVPS